MYPAVPPEVLPAPPVVVMLPRFSTVNMAAALQVPAMGLFGGSIPLTHSRFIHAITPPPGERGMTAITIPHVLQALSGLNRSDETGHAP